RYPTEKSSTMTPSTIRTLGDQAVIENRPAGRKDSARTAAVDDSSQFTGKPSPVKATVAARGSRSGFAAKKGTATPRHAPTAITATMKPTFVKTSRTLMMSSRRVIVSSAGAHAHDKYLTIASGSLSAVLIHG